MSSFLFSFTLLIPTESASFMVSVPISGAKLLQLQESNKGKEEKCRSILFLIQRRMVLLFYLMRCYIVRYDFE